MRHPTPLIAALLATTVGSLVTASVAKADGPLDAFLPKSGTIVGHVVTFDVPAEDEAINRRFRHAVQDNMDWFRRAVTSNKPGQPLPYDSRMGITEAQYEKLQHMKPTMKEDAAVSIAVKKTSEGGIGFQTSDAPAESLSSVTFPTDEKTAKTPFGTFSIFNMIDQKDPDAPLGVWHGAEWAQVEAPDAAMPSAKIAFGKRADGQGVLYYQVAPYKGHPEQSLVVIYKLD